MTSRLRSGVVVLCGVALGLMACGGPEADDPTGTVDTQLRNPPTLSVSPNPVQAGAIDITHPVATGTGFQSGKSYSLQLQGGYNTGALDMISGSVTADNTGSFKWPFASEVADKILSGPSSTLTATYCKNSNLSSCTTVSSVTLQISADPGQASVSPAAASPGSTFTVSGSGASPGAALNARWDDVLNCSCSWFTCSSCQWTPQSVPLTADGSGNFSIAITPAKITQGYCQHSVTIQDQASGAIVATTQFSFCP